MANKKHVSFRINQSDTTIMLDPNTPLLFALRNELRLIGAKLGCGVEQCGACAVLVDNVATLSCHRAVGEFEGADIVTVEGLEQTPLGRRVINAFVTHMAGQCGYCIPGILVATYALLSADRYPSRQAVERALTTHLCRCGSHAAVLRAIDSLLEVEPRDVE
ncbi:MAG: 2Fe-2S iron-sulfur cluster-binding protein [Pseudomonadota bacterium]